MVYTGLASGYSIESQGDSKVDFFGTNIAFDNLINVCIFKLVEAAATSFACDEDQRWMCIPF